MAKDANLSAPPLAIGSMTGKQLNAELQKGYDDCKAGQVETAEQVFQKLETELGI